MEKRKPYNLKGIMAVYNLFQVAACCYLITGVSDFSQIIFSHKFIWQIKKKKYADPCWCHLKCCQLIKINICKMENTHLNCHTNK